MGEDRTARRVEVASDVTGEDANVATECADMTAEEAE